MSKKKFPTDKQIEVMRKKVCQQIADAAKKNGVSTYTMADDISMARPNVSRILNAHTSPSLDNLLKMCFSAGCTLKIE